MQLQQLTQTGRQVLSHFSLMFLLQTKNGNTLNLPSRLATRSFTYNVTVQIFKSLDVKRLNLITVRRMNTEQVKAIWRSADAVCFDVDSTVLQDEALDELAKFCGVGKEVQEWTNKAMGGGISFRTALQERLKIVQPSRQNVQDFISQHTPQFSPGIKDLVAVLLQRKTDVFLVSGGFRSIIEPAAQILNIPVSNIFANRLKFYFNGDYVGFDEDQPTSESGGKKVVVQKLKDNFNYKKLVVIGDGATDMEASPPAEAFIGYGGNVVRDKVKAGAAWFVTDFQELLQELRSDDR